MQDDFSTGEDYILLEKTEVNFPPSENRIAFSVQMLNDLIPEESETFELHLAAETKESRISITLNHTTISIVDNDGKGSLYGIS